MTTSRLSDRAESMPKAGFIPGLGAGGDCKLVGAFLRQALLAGYFPEAPDIIDMTESGSVSVIPPLDIQAARAERALDCDLVVIHSAGVLAASRALQGRKLRDNQRLVCLAPSVRNPGTTFDKYGVPINEKNLTRFGLTSSALTELEAATHAGGYEPPLIIMPGAGDVPRPIAISAAHARETNELNPPELFAELLSRFATDGLGAWIKKWRHDSRLDAGIDTRTGKPHASLLELSRLMLAREVRPGTTLHVGVEIMDGGSHFFANRKDDGTPGEDAVMADVLGGDFFGRDITENWQHNGVFTPQMF